MKYTLEIPVLVFSSIPSASTRLTVASLYTLPLVVLKSSESASDANRTAKINVPQYFTGPGFCRFSYSHGNDKITLSVYRLF